MIHQIALTLLLLVFSFTLQGQEKKNTSKSIDIFLTKIATDYTSKTYDLIIELNPQKLISAIKTKNNKKNKIKKYPVKVLNAPITLVKAVGISLVSLTCSNFATSRGCDIIIEYPYNIAIGKYKKFHAKLLKVDNIWQLQDSNGNRFNHLFLKAKRALGILVGIKYIAPSMKN